MRRVRINLVHANQRERDGENQAASQVSLQQDKEHGGCHTGLSALSLFGCAKAEVKVSFCGFNSALSEKLMTVRIKTIAPSTIKSWTLGFSRVSMMSAAMRNSRPSSR